MKLRFCNFIQPFVLQGCIRLSLHPHSTNVWMLFFKEDMTGEITLGITIIKYPYAPSENSNHQEIIFLTYFRLPVENLEKM